MGAHFQRCQMELNRIKSLHIASWSCFENCRLQAGFQIYVSSSAPAKGSTRTSLWVSESHWVTKRFSIWLLLRILLWCLFQPWPEHPRLWFADNRNQEQSAFLSIFDLLTDVFWRWKAFGLTAQERKPPAPHTAPAWALAVGPDNINKLWAWLIALSETVKKVETPMTAFTFRSCWWNY